MSPACGSSDTANQSQRKRNGMRLGLRSRGTPAPSDRGNALP